MDPLIWGPVFAALGALVTFGIKVYWTKQEQKQKTEPAQRDKEIDHVFSEGSHTERGAELQSLDDRLRRAEVDTGLARPEHPDTGDLR